MWSSCPCGALLIFLKYLRFVKTLQIDWLSSRHQSSSMAPLPWLRTLASQLKWDLLLFLLWLNALLWGDALAFCSICPTTWLLWQNITWGLLKSSESIPCIHACLASMVFDPGSVFNWEERYFSASSFSFFCSGHTGLCMIQCLCSCCGCYGCGCFFSCW